MQSEKRIGNWNRWGEDDERGALNLLSPAVVLEALGACRTGRVYQLGLPVQREGMPNYSYRGAPQRLTLTNQTDEARLAAYGGTPGTGANEDLLIIATHAATHIDAFSHVYDDGALYNGHPHDGMTSYDGAARCGIEKAGDCSGGAGGGGVVANVVMCPWMLVACRLRIWPLLWSSCGPGSLSRTRRSLR